MIDFDDIPDYGYEFGHEGRRTDANGIPENAVEYHRTYCDHCGEWFEFEWQVSVNGVPDRRYCSTECQSKARKSRQSPEQAEINAYLERMKDHPGWD